VAGYGIDQVVDHYTKIIGTLDAKPIVIGHSFGGIIAQRLLGQNLAAAGVAIDAAPIKGVIYLPPPSLRVASVALRNPANRRRAVALTARQFRYGFGNALSEQESAELFERWTIPSPGRPLFEAASANLSPRSPAKVDTANATRGPLLLTAGGKDHTAPVAIIKSTQAVPQVPCGDGVHGVPGPRSFARNRQRVAPGRGHRTHLAQGTVTVGLSP
jgi:pimeloyl-ACP methyl ester carboxylesterase